MKRTTMRYTTPILAFLSFAVLLGYTTIINHYPSAFAQINNTANQSEQRQNQSGGGDNPLSKVPVIGQLAEPIAARWKSEPKPIATGQRKSVE